MKPAHAHLPGLMDWAALLLLTVLWGSAFAFIKHGVETLPPGGLIFVPIFKGVKFLSTESRIERQRKRAFGVTMATLVVLSIALGWLLICWGWGPWILPRSVYVAPFFATMPMWHLGFSLILLSLTPDARWGTFVMSCLLTALCAAQFLRNSAQLRRRRPTRAPAQVRN